MNEEQMNVINQFWKEGQDAFRSGISQDDNPYKTASRIAKSSWMGGWLSAKAGVLYV